MLERFFCKLSRRWRQRKRMRPIWMCSSKRILHFEAQLVRIKSKGIPPEAKANEIASGVLIWIPLCNLCVLCDSVVVVSRVPSTTESQRTQRLHREKVQTKTLPNSM